MGEFGYYQAQLDLKYAARFLVEKLKKEVSCLSDKTVDGLGCSETDVLSEWNVSLSQGDLDAALTLVWADDSAQKTLLGTCLALVDRFEHPSRGTDFDWEWHSFQSVYKSAPAPLRSAIMNGLEWARRYQKVSDTVCPSITDRTTRSVEDILPRLKAIARRMTEQQIERVALADYGQDVQKHKTALSSLIASESLLYPDGDVWFPAEVVELTSHSPSQPAFTECTAIVLINSLADDDWVSNAEFRFSQNAGAYNTLSEHDRGAIIQALRYFYETNNEWQPFEGRAAARLPVSSFLPWEPPSDTLEDNKRSSF
ncbi:hypothetical protein [Marivita hallyeonensis]|uniref:Uncharacterized protein n=1 Tax=Marivita hallyeonensis TaxID=996342 RepID=A0A1M5XX05_9RHOB|nr:hypothetical protein [Marivita hallyeonensis]SHI04276.1 hypothetical protein SAMN05443551_4175 [Marivita hallyeonensis]